MPQRYLFCYDIPDDVRRLAVSRLLSGYGVRVQWSMFECCLTGRELRQALTSLAHLIDADADRLAVFECGAAGVKATTQYADQPVDYWIA
jgi:CRISPR-associated protein Cas2